MGLSVFSFGGGVQSTACLVLAEKLGFDTFVFANVGEQAENPKTLKYIEEYSKPYAEAHGVKFIEVQWTGEKGVKRGQKRDLYQDLLDANRTIDIPIRLNSGAFGNRKCTVRYKVEQIAKWTEAQGATPENPAIVGVGISWDESERIGDDAHPIPHHKKVYPLCEAATRMNRVDCHRVILEAGLPRPPKSSCWFCPFKRKADWEELRRDEPELFEKAIGLEDHLNEVRKKIGKDKIGLSPGGLRVLDDYVQLSVFEGCESGYCWT